jgi:hypothetical protein
MHRPSFAPVIAISPRDYDFKVNRKARRKALRAALSLHAGRGSIAIVDAASFSEPSTADAYDSLVDWKDAGSVVVITSGDGDVNTNKSFRNIERVRAVVNPNQIGVYEITSAQNLIISQDALEVLSNLASSTIDRASKKPIKAVPVGKRPPNAKFTAQSASTEAKAEAPAPEAAPAEEAAAESEATE